MADYIWIRAILRTAEEFVESDFARSKADISNKPRSKYFVYFEVKPIMRFQYCNHDSISFALSWVSKVANIALSSNFSKDSKLPIGYLLPST